MKMIGLFSAVIILLLGITVPGCNGGSDSGNDGGNGYVPPPPPVQYTLGTSVNPDGAGTVTPSSGTYNDGTEVILTATPAQGYIFESWSGSATGTVNSITISMDGDKFVVANFQPEPPSVAEIIAEVQKAVVRIETTFATGSGHGSGSIISSRGYVLTASYNVEGVTTIEIMVPNLGTFQATVVATEGSLALLKITSDRTDFPTVEIGQVSDVEDGIDVLLIGFSPSSDPDGPASAIEGKVIGILEQVPTQFYIQTDVAAVLGNSGGSLITTNGKMIGMLHANLNDTGLSVHIENILSFLENNPQ